MWFLFTLAVVLLLFAFPRKMSVILAAGALVAGIVGGYVLWQKRQLAIQENAVAITVVYSLEACNVSEPLLFTIINNSSMTVARLEWVFSARRPGNRSELTGDWLKVYTRELAIEPGQQQSTCYPAPRPGQHAVKRATDDPANLELGIRSRQISFAP